MRKKFSLRPQVMYGFKETDFRSIYSYSEKYVGYFIYICNFYQIKRKW